VHADPGTPRHLIRWEGEIDLASGTTIRATLNDAIDRGEGDVEVEMSRVTFIGATGLNILVSASHRLREGGRLLIVKAPSPTVRRVLRLCQMEQILQIEDA
jgi:anti-anti-sigma factor